MVCSDVAHSGASLARLATAPRSTKTRASNCTATAEPAAARSTSFGHCVIRDDARAGLQRPKREPLAAHEFSAFDAPRDQAFAVTTIDVLNHEAQRAVVRTSRALQRAQRLQERRTFPPCRERSGNDDVVAAARRDRYDRVRRNTELREKLANLARTLFEDRCASSARSSLLIATSTFAEPEPLQEERLAARLMRDPLVRGNDHHRSVDFGRAASRLRISSRWPGASTKTKSASGVRTQMRVTSSVIA